MYLLTHAAIPDEPPILCYDQLVPSRNTKDGSNRNVAIKGVS